MANLKQKNENDSQDRHRDNEDQTGMRQFAQQLATFCILHGLVRGVSKFKASNRQQFGDKDAP